MTVKNAAEPFMVEVRVKVPAAKFRTLAAYGDRHNRRSVGDVIADLINDSVPDAVTTKTASPRPAAAVVSPPSPPTAEQVLEFLPLYRKGLADPEIAALLDVSVSTVARRRNGLGLPPNGQPGRKPKSI